MRSSFSSSRRRITATAQPRMDENYDLKGLNLVAPDQVMPAGETPFAINNRRYADNDNETSVAMRTRRGSEVLSTPLGEVLDQQNIAATTGDVNITDGVDTFIPFIAGSNTVLTRVDLNLKKSLNTRGYLIVELYTDNIGLPGQKIGQTSIAPNLISDTYAWASALVMDSPPLAATQQYWVGVKMQELGVGAYQIAKTATGNLHITADGGKTYSNQGYSAQFKTYVSTAGFIKGFTKRYPEDTPFLTLFAMNTGVYKMANFPATPSLITGSAIAVASEKVRFLNIDERTVWFDGISNGILWDGVAAPAPIVGAPTALGVPVNGLFFENRLLLVPKGDQTRIDFSALYNFASYPEVNFFYIGRPKSPDWITALHEFRGNATVFTKETKWTLQGTDIQTFMPIPHVGTKGAIHQEATAVGKEAIYFMADDRHIYSWNGVTDTQISDKIFPELKKILDLDKVRFHLFNNQLRVYYNRNPDSEVSSMLLYDIGDKQWYKDTGRNVMGSMEWNFDNNELVEFSNHAGWLFFGERGYSDLGKPIDFKYWTNYKAYGSGAAKDRIKRFRPIVRPADSSYFLKVGKDIDFQNRPAMIPWLVDSGGAKWGTFNWGDGTTYGGAQLIDNTAAMSGRGKHTQFRFEHDGINQPVQLLGYIAMIKSGRPR